jgi:hypothetical protein
VPSTYRFQPNRKAISEFATGPTARALVMGKAERVKAAAEADAETFRRTGHYAGCFEVAEYTAFINRLPRAAARVENTAEYAAVVEVGRKGQEGRHVLSRALDAARD